MSRTESAVGGSRVSSLRDRIDPESRAPLDEILRRFPGGVNRVPDLDTRRQLDLQLALEGSPNPDVNSDIDTEDQVIAKHEDGSSLAVRVHRPKGVQKELPCILFIHGGGMILGGLESEDASARMLCQMVQAVVVSIDYRLAPEYAYPAQVDDCYACLSWIAAHTTDLGIDASRLAVYGGSAGGGLTIATVMRARDNGGPPIAFQMAIYPMIDDRNETSSSHEVTDIGVWDRCSAQEAWALYLAGQEPDHYSAPARATDLTGLPPTFIDVGEVDMFRDEDIAFAARLLVSGVPTELHVYPGAYHASELIAPAAALSRRIWSTRISALVEALSVRR